MGLAGSSDFVRALASDCAKEVPMWYSIGVARPEATAEQVRRALSPCVIDVHGRRCPGRFSMATGSPSISSARRAISSIPLQALHCPRRHLMGGKLQCLRVR